MTRHVLITGGGSHNLGADLMTRLAVDGVSRTMPDSRAVGPFSPTDRELYRSLGMSEAPWVRGNRIYGRPVPRLPLNQTGILRNMIPDDLLWSGRLRAGDVVLDISGFSYGSPWPQRSIRRLIKDLREWRQRGIIVVFAPQSFGEFCTYPARLKKKLFTELLSVGLLAPRDVPSAANLASLSDSQFDFPEIYSDLVLGSNLLAQAGERRYAGAETVIIPSIMPVLKGLCSRSELIGFYKRLAMDAGSSGIVTSVASQDDELADELSVVLKLPYVPRMTAPDSIRAISGCTEVISGRFHGSVVGLSLGKAVVSVGWHDKYFTLHQSVGGGSLLDLRDGSTAVVSVLNGAVSTDSARSDARHSIERFWERFANVTAVHVN